MNSPVLPDRTSTNDQDLRNCLLTLGLAFGVLLGLLYLADRMSSFGFTMIFGIPLFAGAIVGHTGRFSQVSKIAAAIVLLGGALLSLLMWNIAGILCTTIAGIVLIVPVGLGALLGHHFHQWQRSRRQSGPSTTLALVFFAAIAGLLYAEQRLTPEAEIESVTTQRILDVPREAAWRSVVFYEEVGLEPPLLAQIGLPYPIRTEGEDHQLGSLTRCVYSTGYLVKRITAFDPLTRLAFDVIEQHGVEDQSFELLSGSFEFESLGEGQTRVVLTTVYRPLLQARFYWRPFEERLAHELHDYVLDAMSMQAELETAVAGR